MRIVCIYTPEFKASTAAANLCVKSAKVFGYNVEKHKSVFFKDMDKVHKKHNLKKRYIPEFQSNGTLTPTTCPATRMANGTTHFLLYKWCIENNEPICIVEHDAEFVGNIPEAKKNGIIQISSHTDHQLNAAQMWSNCIRGQKMKLHEPKRELFWTHEVGIVKHPLSGTNGTSGYIISPGAAQSMVEYIEDSGIAFGDRLRTEHIGEGNLWLQKPQSVFCYHGRVRSHVLARNMK